MKIFKTVPTYDFVAYKKLAQSVSVVLCLLSIVLYFTVGFNYGIDFKGGNNIQVKFSEKQNVEKVRANLTNSVGLTPTVVNFGEAGDNEILIQFTVQDDEKGNEELLKNVKASLVKFYPDSEIRQIETIGPKVGAELKESAFYSVIFSLLVILLYLGIRFKYYYGLAALAALVHDTLITLGMIILFGKDFNLASLAAILTINGYSLNDTIIVFDRIRENVGKYASKKLANTINLSVNETLSRTLATSLTTLIAITFLFIFGGEGTSSFSFTIIVGILVGTYSSVFIASPILLRFHDESEEKGGNKIVPETLSADS